MLSRDVLGPILATLMAMIVANCNESCMPAKSANDAYIMELLGCVQKAHTREESEACRKDVNRRYGLCEPGDWPRISPCD